MKQNARSAGDGWRHRHAWLIVTACGLLGAPIGFAAALSISSFSVPRGQAFEYFEGVWRVGFVSATAGGILLGILAGLLLVRTGSGGIECPRCGTLNNAGAASCSACDLPFS